MDRWLLVIAITTIFQMVDCVDDPLEINIIFVNDLQYNIFPVTDENILCESETDCSGGLSRLVNITDEYESSLLLSAGGALAGEWYNILKCATISEAMVEANFDAVALDAEMFQYGNQLASPCLEKLGNKLLSANSGVNAIKSMSKNYAEAVMVGIIGFTDEEKLKTYGILNGTDATKAVEAELQNLKEKDKTLFNIAIGETTVEKATEIAKIDGINLVLFNGDLSGEELDDGQFYFKEIGTGKYIASLNISGTGTVPEFLAGIIKFEFNTEESTFSLMDNTTEDYGNLTEKAGDLNEFLKTKITVLKTPVTTLNVNITFEGCATEECLLGNLFTDAIVSAVQDSAKNVPWEEMVKIAVWPGASLNNINFIEGDISVEYIYEFFNPDTLIHSASLNGKTLKQLFETSVKDYDQTSAAKNFLQVSGLISVEFDFEKKQVTQIKTVGDSFINSTKLQDVDLNDEKAIHQIVFPASLLEINDYQFLKEVSKELDITIGGAIEEYFRGIKYLTLFPVGQRITEFTSVPSNTKTCPNNTAEAVLLTLFILGLMVGLGFVVWKYVIPRVSARRNSTLPLVGNI